MMISKNNLVFLAGLLLAGCGVAYSAGTKKDASTELADTHTEAADVHYTCSRNNGQHAEVHLNTQTLYIKAVKTYQSPLPGDSFSASSEVEGYAMKIINKSDDSTNGHRTATIYAIGDNSNQTSGFALVFESDGSVKLDAGSFGGRGTASAGGGEMLCAVN